MLKGVPTKAQKEWMDLGYGMFIHFGPNSIEGVDWGDGKFPVENFEFEKLDIKQWARVAAQSGMRYAVLTTKHHDGFCLWPSKYTEYSVKNSPSQLDIVATFVNEFRSAGIRVGLYYSLWDKNFPDYENDEEYFKYMRNQITELLTNYGDIVELWFDGAWDKDFPTRDWPYNTEWEKDTSGGLSHGEPWHWKELYELIHKIQPECLVINNSSSDRPGQVRYHPIDVRTAEHFDFIYNEVLFEPDYNTVFENTEGEKVFLPLEFCTTLNPGWFSRKSSFYSHPSVDTICGWYKTARTHEANLLLNVGPNKDGVIPECNIFFLRQAAKQLGLV